jgi:hypothetical protein
MDLIGDEAKTIVGTTYQKPGGWWVQGVEVFHQLHCLVSGKTRACGEVFLSD